MSTLVPDPLCPVCQAALQPTWAACPHCGTPIVWRDGQPVPRPIAVPLARPPGPTAPPPPAPQIVYVQAPPPPKRRSGCGLIGGLLVVIVLLCGVYFLANPGSRDFSTPAQPISSGAGSTGGKPQLTVAEQTYLNAVAAESSELGPLLTQFGTESNAPDLFSTDWKLRMAVILAGIQTTTTAASHLTAPPTLTAVDTPYQSGIGHLAHMVALITQGIDQKDPALITQANTELTQGSADLQTATTALRAFMAAHQ